MDELESVFPKCQSELSNPERKGHKAFFGWLGCRGRTRRGRPPPQRERNSSADAGTRARGRVLKEIRPGSRSRQARRASPAASLPGRPPPTRLGAPGPGAPAWRPTHLRRATVSPPRAPGPPALQGGVAGASDVGAEPGRSGALGQDAERRLAEAPAASADWLARDAGRGAGE